MQSIAILIVIVPGTDSAAAHATPGGNPERPTKKRQRSCRFFVSDRLLSDPQACASETQRHA
ncbi:exported hypothetical protein [Cupriavidus phytorum]|uniref:Uncharacterized protein n=1 Tax=Cupriavidus taiwanensis TaxID=164546 RepID=A0A975X8R2_9BURK|nr:exported hypothetical protein [Cupriavidus taiwanensis]SOY62298.1 exported hypothetical protein [Cupriavidus taiwanensis]